MSHRHLTLDQRETIACRHAEGWNQSQIARELGVSQSTVSRELRRNRGVTGYRPCKAHSLARQRRRLANQRRPKKMDDPQLAQVIQEGLRQYWSPEQIAGRLELKSGHPVVSHETIYRWIWQARRQGQDWHGFLRQSHRKRRRRARGKPDRRGKIPDRTFIDRRPAEVESRRRFGHWEGDTLVGHNHKGAVVTHVERKSQYLIMGRLPQRDHRELVKESKRAFARHERKRPLPRKTETLDNGLEFWSHKKLGKSLGMAIYFAHPHHPWERGVNEQLNGLVRQFLPKGCELANVALPEIVRIENLLNNRPRKTLGYRTPIEVLRRHRVYASRS